jgi:hypothetical protein
MVSINIANRQRYCISRLNYLKRKILNIILTYILKKQNINRRLFAKYYRIKFQILVPQQNLPILREKNLSFVRRSKNSLFRYLTPEGGFHKV